jgi:hypothetical protein
MKHSKILWIFYFDVSVRLLLREHPSDFHGGCHKIDRRCKTHRDNNCSV